MTKTEYRTCQTCPYCWAGRCTAEGNYQQGNRVEIGYPEDSGKNDGCTPSKNMVPSMKPSPKKPMDKAINVRIPLDMHHALVKYCQGRGLKMAWVIPKAIADFIGYE